MEGGASMSESEVPTDDFLLDLAGAKVFQRGKELSHSGAVVLVHTIDGNERGWVSQVQGTELYDVSLRRKGGHWIGHCTCPHAADGWFCKHLVAVARVGRAQAEGQVLAPDAAAQKKAATLAKRARTQAGNAAALEAFVRGQGADALAERMLAWAQAWPDVRRDLLTWMQTAQAQADPAAAKKAVTQILSVRGFLDWRGSSAYARQATKVLDLLDSSLQTDPTLALKLTEQAYKRLHAVMHQADDSGGEIGDVCKAVGGRWLQAVKALGPHPAAFGDRYLELRADEIFDAIGHDQAVKAMGPAATDRYGQRLREAWEQALARQAAHQAEAALKRAEAQALAAAKAATRGRRPPAEKLPTLLDRVEAERRDHGPDSVWSTQLHYESHLRSAGDHDELLRVLRTRLQDPYDHLKLVQHLNDIGRLRDAVTAVRAGLAAFPDDGRLQEEALRAYDRDGWDEEALDLRQRRFAHRPSPATFFEVLATAPRAGADAATLRAAMWQALIQGELDHLAKIRATPWGRGADGPDVSVRLAILLREGRLDDALALVGLPRRASDDLLEALAAALPSTHDSAAAGLLQRVFAWRMPQAKSPYTDVLRLIQTTVRRMPKDEAARWLAQLRAEHRAKRNFILGLPTP